MKNDISLNRVGLLLRNEIIRNYKTYLTLPLVMVGLYLLAGLFNGLNGLNGVKGTFSVYIALITFFAPFMFYGDIFHTVKGVNFTMLPASQNEKFIVSFLQCVLTIPFGLLLTGLLLSLIGAGMTGKIDLIWNIPDLFKPDHPTVHFNWNTLGFFDSYIWSIIGAQSFTFWGIYFFKTRKLWKTFLTGCCLMVGLSILAISAVTVAVGYQESGYFTIFSEEVPRFGLVMNVFATIVVPFALWIWAYLKMRRQQF